MKLLFATSLLPETEATSGFEIANRALLNGLRALGHEVVPIGFANPGKSGAVTEGSINLGEIAVSNGDANPRQKLLWLKRSLQNGVTYAGAKLQILTDQAIENTISQAGPFDAVIINGAPMAAAFEKVLMRKPFIYIAHNIEWQGAAQSAKTAGGFFERNLFAREARLLQSLEARLAQGAKHVFTLGEDDNFAFATFGGKSVSAVPLVVNFDAPALKPRTPIFDAGLIGTWSWAPNRVGLDWFLNEIVPHLPDDFKFAIAGKLPGAPAIKHPGVKLLGRVPSSVDFARQCAVLPLVSRVGTGVQLKTLEAFELGLPTVATSSSLRGIGAITSNCMVEDDPKAFAAALVYAARKGKSLDLDGQKFHTRQKSQMLAALQLGLAQIKTQPFLQAAE